MSDSLVNASDNDRLLQELNDEIAVSMIPVIVYLTVLMFVGLLGNAMVFYYYGFKTRRTSNSIFICTVAVYDLASCSLSIPIEIVDLRFFYMFTNSGACTFMRFVNHIAAIGSAFTLLMIAADRFRRICRPFKRQLRLREAKIVCGISILVALLFSWPALVFYKPIKSVLENKDGVKIQGCDCTTTREESYKVYLWVFNAIYLLCFITSVIVLCVMYTLIGRVLYKHKQSRKRYSTRLSAVTNSSEVALKDVMSSNDDESSINTNNLMSDGTTPNNCTNTSVNEDDVTIERYTSSEEIGDKVHDNKNMSNVATKNTAEINNCHSKSKDTNQLDLKTMKYTLIMLVITAVFIISFLPYLVLIIWKAFQSENYAGYDYSVGFQIGIRSYFLNSAINPVTYGFFNSKFRTFFQMKLFPCCKRSKEATTVSTSSGAS